MEVEVGVRLQAEDTDMVLDRDLEGLELGRGRVERGGLMGGLDLRRRIRGLFSSLFFLGFFVLFGLFRSPPLFFWCGIFYSWEKG